MRLQHFSGDDGIYPRGSVLKDVSETAPDTAAAAKGQNRLPVEFARKRWRSIAWAPFGIDRRGHLVWGLVKIGIPLPF